MRKIPAPPLSTAPLAFLLALGALVAGCAQPTHEERVAEMRGRYSAELQNFIVREEPRAGMEAAGEAMAMDEGAMDEGAMDEGDAGETGDETAAEEAAVPVEQKVLLDILIRNENQENLPWLTLDVAQVAEAGAEGDEATWEEVVGSPSNKATWRIYVDTSTIGRGPGTSVTHQLEDVEGYEPGDGFVVTVRHPVPPAERDDYPEFTPGS